MDCQVDYLNSLYFAVLLELKQLYLIPRDITNLLVLNRLYPR